MKSCAVSFDSKANVGADLLESGDMEVMTASDGLYVYTRYLENRFALVIVNMSDEPMKLSFKSQPHLFLRGIVGAGSLLSDGRGRLNLDIEKYCSRVYLGSSLKRPQLDLSLLR